MEVFMQGFIEGIVNNLVEEETEELDNIIGKVGEGFTFEVALPLFISDEEKENLKKSFLRKVQLMLENPSQNFKSVSQGRNIRREYNRLKGNQRKPTFSESLGPIILETGKYLLDSYIDHISNQEENNYKIKLNNDLMLLDENNDIETINNRVQCVICLNNEKNIKFTCGHMSTCISCTKNLLLEKGKLVDNYCPICRQKILSVKRIYY